MWFFFTSEDEEIEWVKEIMTGVLQARGALEATKRPRGTKSNPALSCRDLRVAHVNLTDGNFNSYLHNYYYSSSFELLLIPSSFTSLPRNLKC